MLRMILAMVFMVLAFGWVGAMDYEEQLAAAKYKRAAQIDQATGENQ